VGLAGREEEVDLVEKRLAGLLTYEERALETFLVGYQHGVRDSGRVFDGAKHLVGVGKLRDHVRPDERRHLETAHPRAREAVDQAHLVGGVDYFRFVLEAIAWTDLADLDFSGEVRLVAHSPKISSRLRRTPKVL
jgi:hypothetical protein